MARPLPAMQIQSLRRINLFLILALSVGVTSNCRTPRRSHLNDNLTADARGLALDEVAHPDWVLGGYAHEAPAQKIYLKIAKGRIESIATEPPANVPLIDTESFIFPGLIDMHNHMQYNVLPLWENARGQYVNRFEWRGRSLPYKKAVSGNMGAFKGDTLCGAVRWAELKAITGGATSIQGVGGHTDCAGKFALRNLEEPRAFGDQKSVRSYVDIVNPTPIAKIFDHAIKPIMAADHVPYEIAYKKWLSQIGVQSWLEDFQDKFKNAREFHHGVRLLLNSPAGFNSDRTMDIVADSPAIHALRTESRVTKAMIRSALDSVMIGPAPTEQMIPQNRQPLAQALLQAPYWVRAESYEAQVGKMVDWLSDFKKGPAPEETASLMKQAYGFLTPDANLAFHRDVRKFITDFNNYVWSTIDSGLQNDNYHAVVAHLAEGRRDDAYNQSEYPLADALGLTRPGMVFIHGVGLTDFQRAKTQGISLVWSPFSNLLLYGQTLDIKAAIEAGVNVALGPDWSPTGSKHMLDEMKIAKRYLEHNKVQISRNGSLIPVSDKMLFEMATINAARALRVDDRLGRIRLGFIADLLLVERLNPGDPYQSLLSASQKEVTLVVTGGQPLYGERAMVEAAARAFNDVAAVQHLPLTGISGSPPPSCAGLTKAIRLPANNSWDTTHEAAAAEFKSIATLHKVLDSSLKTHAQAWREKALDARAWELGHIVDAVDPLFNCEDTDYTSRVAAFVETEVAENARLREERRLKEFAVDAASDSGENN